MCLILYLYRHTSSGRWSWWVQVQKNNRHTHTYTLSHSFWPYECQWIFFINKNVNNIHCSILVHDRTARVHTNTRVISGTRRGDTELCVCLSLCVSVQFYISMHTHQRDTGDSIIVTDCFQEQLVQHRANSPITILYMYVCVCEPVQEDITTTCDWLIYDYTHNICKCSLLENSSNVDSLTGNT